MVTWCQGQKQQSLGKNPQDGEEPRHKADTVLEPQEEILEKTNHEENARVIVVQ